MAISWYFFVEGASLGLWAAMLPTVKDEQDLSNTTLGLILVAAVFGAICSIPFVSYFTGRLGSGPALFIGGLLSPFLFPLISIKNNLPVFVVAVFALGFFVGWMDICMNGQAVLCEKMTRTPSLGLFHAIYAIGGLSGALFGGTLLTHGVSVFFTIIYFTAVTLLPEICLSCWLFTYQEEKLMNQTNLMAGYVRRSADHHSVYSDNKTTHSEQITPELASILDSTSSQTDWEEYSEEQASLLDNHADNSFLICLCVLCFLAYLGEGSVGDWSAIYLDETMSTSPLTSTFGYICFELAVAIARFSSDYLVFRVGRKRLLHMAGLIGSLGLFVASSAAWVYPVYGYRWALATSMVGFALCGAGIGVVAPSVISLAGDVRGVAPSDAIGLVSSIGYVGVMVGPPFLGGLSSLCNGLQYSFIVDAGLICCISFLAFGVYSHRTNSGDDESPTRHHPTTRYEEVIQ